MISLPDVLQVATATVGTVAPVVVAVGTRAAATETADTGHKVRVSLNSEL